MTPRRLSATIAVAAALFACSRQAAEPASEPPAMTPASGAAAPITGVNPGCAENFKAFDENADGRVSQVEFNAMPHARPDPATVFGDRDRDADGSLTESEFCVRWRGRSGGALGPGPPPGGRMGTGRGGRHQGGPNGPRMGPRCEQHFDAFDANRDGNLAKEEFAAWPHIHGDPGMIFDERDRDRDGTVTRAEFCSGWSDPLPR